MSFCDDSLLYLLMVKRNSFLNAMNFAQQIISTELS